jgi:O-antigen ligase
LIGRRDAQAGFATAAPDVRARPAATQLLHGGLFLTILFSPLVFIEPSPYEAVAGLLAFICIVSGVTLSRKILPLTLLLLVLNISGAMSLLLVVDDSEALKYASISFYLAITAIMFACIFAQDSLRRLKIMRKAYLIAAVIASLVGIAGYFGIIPAAELYGRARSTFKDPNVFGPFLVLPLLFLVQSVIARSARFRDIVFMGIMLFALLLSFSRGAWGHFFISALILLVMMFLTAPNVRVRMRLIMLSTVSALAMTGLVAVAVSFGSIGEMLQQRAQLTQSYDVGSGGRFGMQEMAVDAVLEHPNGMGPFAFANTYGLQQHNVYLQAFLVYGWAGGMSYVVLVLLTLLVGFRFALVNTPWQPYLIAAFAAFCGEALEGFIIDTDHWRHFFLLLGIIWGLVAATISLAAQRRAASRAYSYQ